MINTKFLSIGFICAMVLSVSAEAKLYKWVDNNGVTHYGEVIPPEYANKDRDTLNKAGLLNKRPEKIDPATIHAKEEAEQKRNIEMQAETEQKRRDSALLNTYSNEKEIDMARERSLVLINARIDSNKMLIKSTQTTLDELNKEADSRNKTGKKIPVSLTRDMEQAKARSDRYTAELDKSEKDLDDVRTRFDNEKTLYRKLKGDATRK
jgi:hypothetical protein